MNTQRIETQFGIVELKKYTKEINGEEITIKEKWPFLIKKGNDGEEIVEKSISPSSLLSPLSHLIYGIERDENAEKAINQASKNGIEIEESIYNFLKTHWWGALYCIKSLNAQAKAKNMFKYILSQEKSLSKNGEKFSFKPIVKNNIGYEFINNELFACENDIEFNNRIWEIKSSRNPKEYSEKLEKKIKTARTFEMKTELMSELDKQENMYLLLTLYFKIQGRMQEKIMKKPVFVMWIGENKVTKIEVKEKERDFIDKCVSKLLFLLKLDNCSVLEKMNLFESFLIEEKYLKKVESKENIFNDVLL